MRLTREAIVLAGGFGTRLSSVISDVPKPMAPIAGRPFLRFLLDQLAAAEFDRVIIADGYKRECIESCFGDRYRGMELLYSSEVEPLLTGGAVKQALELCKGEWVFVLNGDTYCEVDFQALEACVGEGAFACAMAVSMVRESDRYETVEVARNGRVLAFRERACCENGLVNAGVYLLRRDSLDGMPERFSLETCWFEMAVSAGCLGAVVSEGAFIDIGVPEDYQRAQSLIAPLAKHWKLAFFDRDGTINIDTGHPFELEKLKLVPEATKLIRRYNSDPDYKVVVVTNQAGIAKGIYIVEQMQAFNQALNSCLKKDGAHIDAFYFCPHHPDFTGECSCRKPMPGMLLSAIRDFDADPAECVLYGDRESDMKAAKAAGIVHLVLVGDR